MTLDPRTPVLVAVGEITDRSDTINDPIDLAIEAARRALADAKVPIADRIDTVASPGILLMPRDNPAHRIADAMALPPGRRISCPVGGNTPQYLVGQLGTDIMAGKSDAALIVGAEAGRSARSARSAGTVPAVDPASGVDAVMGDDRPGLSPIENAAGLRTLATQRRVANVNAERMSTMSGNSRTLTEIWEAVTAQSPDAPFSEGQIAASRSTP